MSTNPTDRKPKVYIMNLSGHDFSEAHHFGEVIFLTDGKVRGDKVNTYFRSLCERLEGIQSGDYIVCTSLQVINLIAGIVIGWKKISPINLLYFSNGRYISIPLEFTELLELMEKERVDIELSLAIEFGFKQCERGNNLERALTNFIRRTNKNKTNNPFKKEN